MRTYADSWQPEKASLDSCCSASSAHALLAHRHRDWGCLLVLPPQTENVERGLGYLSGASSSPALKTQSSPDSLQGEGASLESCCSASSAHGTARTEAQRLGLLACLTTSNFQRVPEMGVSVLCASISPGPKVRMSADRSQGEGASLESCCSASSAHGTARTEAQRLGLLACFTTSN